MKNPCPPGCNCGRHTKPKEPKDEPYNTPLYSAPKGRFWPLGASDGCYQAVVLSSGE